MSLQFDWLKVDAGVTGIGVVALLSQNLQLAMQNSEKGTP